MISSMAGLWLNSGSITLANGRDFPFVPDSGVFSNTGSFIKSGTGTSSVPALVTLNNTGLVSVAAGTLRILGPVSQVAGNSLTGGVWEVGDGATLLLSSASITNNAAGPSG